MAAVSSGKGPQCHVLQFLHNKDDSCAVTVLCNAVRFHILADVHDLQDRSKNGKKVFAEYKQLLKDLKQAEGAVDADSESDDQTSSPTGNPSKRSRDGDSGVDVTGPQDDDGGSPEQVIEAESAIQTWMLSPFGDILTGKAPNSKAPKQQSLQDWYDCETFYYKLQLENGRLQAVEQNESDTLKKRIDDLTPNLLMPKYILNLDVPWFAANDLTVLDTSDEPAPYHPCRVSADGKTYFLKLVDTTQPQPTKRELSYMKQIEKLGLHKQMRVPLVEGLVGYADTKNRIMGFLMTDIEDAKPLVKMLDPAVPQAKRDKWAAETERMRNLLHENGIVWGDAKADNFMVDKHDILWMIDFGGSYTEGWVDPELNETEEGDDMGVERVAGALRDPDKNTYNPYEGEDEEEAEGEGKEEEPKATTSQKCTSSRKRKADHDRESESVSKRSKKGKPQDQADAVTESYCYCDGEESGEMVGCDNVDCERKWFHFECVGLEEAPRRKKWFCDDCRSG